MDWKLCDTEFWNSNTTWYTENPTLSPCFKDTVLVWLPSLLIFLTIIREAVRIKNSRTREISWNTYNRLRILLAVILLLVTLCDFNPKSDTISSFLAPIIKSFYYFVLIIVYFLQRKVGIHTSGSVWCYWLLSLVCDTIDLYVIVKEFQAGSINVFSLVVRSIQYILVALIFILECRGDTPVYVPDTSSSQPDSPELQASFFSTITFWWYNQYLFFGYKNKIKFSNLWKTLKRDRAGLITPKFMQAWSRKLVTGDRKSYYITTGDRQKPNSLVTIIAKLFWSRLLFAAFVKFTQDSLQFITPMILKLLLSFINTPNAPIWHGALFAISLIILPTIQSICLGNYFYRVQVIGLQVRTMIIGAVYRKALVLSGSSRQQSTGGEIVNLMAVDSQRIQDVLLYVNLIWSAPVQIIIAITLLYRELGVSIFAGVLFMAIAMPVNAWLANRIKFYQIKTMNVKDQRIKQMNELLSGIKVVKLYAWENSFMDSLFGFRNKELQYLNKVQTFDAIHTVVWLNTPFIVAVVTFGVYVYIDVANILTAEKAFVALSLFNLLRFPLSMLPILVTNLALAQVSKRRINKFLNNDELVQYVTREDEQDAIAIEGGTLSWVESNDQNGEPILKDIDLHIRPKSFVAIVGQVASGKSSLLSSILGEMHRLSGRFNICKNMRIAYVPQQAWIQNMSIKDNILFGASVDEDLYQRILTACSLHSDLATLPGEDQAEIGEKGINLSGGQKQRVSLARACYSNSDIYLLDDPLSALDSHVGKHIFEEILSSSTGILKDKTRLLATNSLFVLPYVDHIIVLKDGRIVESGSYNDLMSIERGLLAEYIRQYSSKKEEDSGAISIDTVVQHKDENLAAKESVIATEKKLDSQTSAGKLIDIEKLETESVNYRVYLSYFKAVSYYWLTFVIVSQVTATCFNVATTFWLSIWSSDSEDKTKANDPDLERMRLIVYALLGAMQNITSLAATVALSRGGIRAAKSLHSRLLKSILHSPMAFFDTTPMGRIVNRFAKDVDVLDLLLPVTFRSWLYSFLQVISTLFVIGYSFPMFMALAIPLAIIYYIVLKVFIVTTRQLKRLESITRSPIYSQFSETLTGISTIRAYGSVDRFIEYSDNLVDRNQSCSYPNIIANRWLSVRLELLGNLITSSAAVFSVYHRGVISAGVAGLTISYSLSITQTLSWLVRQVSDLETNIVSVERILEYVVNKQEDSWTKDNRPPKDWPDKGLIQYHDYSTRYRDDIPLVLKNISITIKPSEKLGIVGRTGSGKSSLSLSLFRLLESASGCITIDGLNLADYGLHDIRSKLTIIPQDPVLFSGTLRFNLDPLKIYSDSEIWRALELAHLNTYVSSLNSGLSHHVDEYGENFSVGQRQLICLARAILRKTKILLLDEATASVDVETDSIVQRTIREIFADCTIITIAHRLHTILDSDRILVLDGGEVKELDSPAKLISNESSAFSSLVRDAGIDKNRLLDDSLNKPLH